MNNRTFASILPALARLLAVLCCLLAIGAALRMDMTMFPDRAVPAYVIQLAAPGLGSDMVDEAVARPVEESIRALGSALTITTESRPQKATVTVKTTEGLGSDYKERLEKNLEEISKQLPIQEWSISQDNLADTRIGFYLLHGADVQTLSDVARHTVYEKLIRIPGIARVEVDDRAVRKQVEIIFRPSMLSIYGLTPQDVLSQLRGDVAAEPVGTTGQAGEQTDFLWSSRSEGPQGLGKHLIATTKGYIPLKTVADIRDMRGSKGEEVSVYRGDPAVGITLYAADAGQVPDIRKQAAQAMRELNQEAGQAYAIDLFEDSALPLAGAIDQLALLALLAAVLCALFIGMMQRGWTAAVLSLFSVFMAAGALLGGMWLTGIPLTLSSLGPVTVFALFYAGAGSALFHRFSRLELFTPKRCLGESWKLMKPLLLAVAVLAACWSSLMMTDFLEGEDRIVLYDALPVLALGTVSLLLVYGLIAPVLAGGWMNATEPVASVRSTVGRRVTGYLHSRWERFVRQGFLPYGITLVLSLAAVVLLHSFVLTTPYAQTRTNDKSLSLAMIRESSIDEAIRAAQIAEERLRGIAEVKDLYTIASRDKLSIYLKVKDKYSWTRSRTDLEKEWDKQLRGIPGTDPFALTVSDDEKTRLEFTVKGPSLQTARDIAQEVLQYLKELSWRDEDGREIITDERMGPGSTTVHMEIRPKPDMLARYRVTEDQIKSQLQSYLGEQSAGSVYWNERRVPVSVRFPDKWMDSPEQVKNILIRTPVGTVKLADLVEWSIGEEPPVYQREDGLYVFKVSSAVSDPRRIEGLSYLIPERMQKTMTIPEGYTLLNDDERKKLSEEQSDKKDWSIRFLAVAGLAAVVVLCSLLLQRRTRDGVFALALLPVMAGGVMLGLLILDRQMNVMGFYGIAASLAVLMQQALILLDDLFEARAGQVTIWDAVHTGSTRGRVSQLAVFAAVAMACVPLAAGGMDGVDAFASFACALLFGTVVAAFAALVLVPGMQYAAEWRQAARTELSLPLMLARIRVWWENGQVRRQDARERKRAQKRKHRQLQSKAQHAAAKRQQELSREDFLPLSTTSRDTSL